VTDDRPVIDAPTAEQLSDRIPAVQPPPTRSRIREQRRARVSRRHRRTGITMIVVGLLMVGAGVVSWFSLKSDATPSTTSVSGVSVTSPPIAPSSLDTTIVSTTLPNSNP
jgi:hypothetical protein